MCPGTCDPGTLLEWPDAPATNETFSCSTTRNDHRLIIVAHIREAYSPATLEEHWVDLVHPRGYQVQLLSQLALEPAVLAF